MQIFFFLSNQPTTQINKFQTYSVSIKIPNEILEKFRLEGAWGSDLAEPESAVRSVAKGIIELGGWNLDGCPTPLPKFCNC